MFKKRLLIGLCSWNNPRLLKRCIESLTKNMDLYVDGIAVVLNQADEESIKFLLEKNIPFVGLPENRGVLAIDYLKPFVENSEYFMNTNDDMIFHKGFVDDILDIMVKYEPCSASCRLIENFYSGNPVVVVDTELRNIYSDETIEKFTLRAESGVYDVEDLIIGWMHPICVKSSDFLAVGGYSGNWDMDFVSGYARDDMFAVLLSGLYQSQGKYFRHIGSNKSFVFHASSETMKRLPNQIRCQDNNGLFQQRTGYTIPQFREAVQAFATFKRND